MLELFREITCPTRITTVHCNLRRTERKNGNSNRLTLDIYEKKLADVFSNKILFLQQIIIFITIQTIREHIVRNEVEYHPSHREYRVT